MSMSIGGVDMDIFKPHTCRSASTGKAHITGVSIDNYSNADSGVPIVHFTNFIAGHLSGMITQEVLNFFTAFCLQLIVHKTFCPLYFKAG